MDLKKVLTVAVILSVSLAGYGCGIFQDDVGFARSVIAMLAKDRYIVRSMIEWPELKVFGIDAGKEYRQLETDSERADYERAFIDSFAKAFKESKISSRDFRRWRVYDLSNPKLVIVAVERIKSKSTLYIYIKHIGLNKKVVGMQNNVNGQKK